MNHSLSLQTRRTKGMNCELKNCYRHLSYFMSNHFLEELLRMETAACPMKELVNCFLAINFNVSYNKEDIFADCNPETLSRYVRAFGNTFKNFHKEKLAAPCCSEVQADLPREKAISDNISLCDDTGCLKCPFKDWEES